MKKTKCPLFIFLVILAYFDSQEKVCSQTQSVGETQKGQMTTSKRLYHSCYNALICRERINDRD